MECDEKVDSRKRSSVSENASWKLMASSNGWKRFSSLVLHVHAWTHLEQGFGAAHGEGGGGGGGGMGLQQQSCTQSLQGLRLG